MTVERLPEEVLFQIFQNLDPLELIPLSRVNQRWHNIVLHPRLHRCIDFQHKHHLSSLVICSYISKFKNSLEVVNLQECYWLKGALLSSALQKCRKLKSLKVLGCDISKKTICSVLKLNSLKRLEWSIRRCDLNFSDFLGSNRNDLLRKVLVSFCSELSGAFSGLDILTIRFPLYDGKSKLSFGWIIQFGVPLICSELCLKKFTLDWVEPAGKFIHFFKISIEGSRVQFQKNELTELNGVSTPERQLSLVNLHEMTQNTMSNLLENGTLSTFLYAPFYHSDQMCASLASLEIKPCIVNLDVPLRFVDATTLTSTACSKYALRYLNLTRIVNIDGHLLQVIASSSPNLEILNLQDCNGCLVPLQGLESLAECCPKLAHLNLKGVHDHTSIETPSIFLEILSKFTNLVSLSFCPCGLGTATRNKSTKMSSSSSHSNSVGQGARVYNDVTQFNIKLNGLESFDCFGKSCSGITEFELVRSSSSRLGFEKFPAFEKSYKRDNHRPITEQCLAKCYLIKGAYNNLMSITNWRNLQRLTLSVPLMQGNLEFLVAVTQKCPKLQFLSLASMNNLSHSGNVVLLQQALSHCHQLRDFRLEQPYFSITESFIQTLSELKHLERVCIIARQGTMKMYSQVVISMFEKCCKLIYFQVLCDISLKASKALMDCLAKRFAAVRPALVVSVVPYFRTHDAVEVYPSFVSSIPAVHLKELFLLGSAVATKNSVTKN